MVRIQTPFVKKREILRLKSTVGELARRWNQIEPSLRNTYEKLKKLSYTYSNGR